MIDDFAKDCLRDELQWVRRSVVDRLDDLSEYDVRRPLTTTGTNLLGLIKHLALSEAVYLGDVFGRPHPEPHPSFDDPGYRNRDSLWVRAEESRADIIEGYRRAWQHSDAMIAELPIDATGYVAWWPQPEVKLFNVMVHVLTETNRHAGHPDILREHLSDADLPAAQVSEWAAHRTLIDEAARDRQQLSRPIVTPQ